MPLYVISCIDKPDSLALRMATRPAHLAYAHSEGVPATVKLGGPYLDDKGVSNFHLPGEKGFNDARGATMFPELPGQTRDPIYNTTLTPNSK